jgi:hypothetical protein
MDELDAALARLRAAVRDRAGELKATRSRARVVAWSTQTGSTAETVTLRAVLPDRRARRRDRVLGVVVILILLVLL